MYLAKNFASWILRVIPAGRNRRLAMGVTTGVFSKGAAFVITLLIVPLTLDYLGPQGYGIWVTMISMLAWISLVDLGIANGLTPMLSAAFGAKRDDLSQKYISTAVWSLAAIALLSAISIAALWPRVNWGEVFNVRDVMLVRDISTAMALAVALFLVQVPLGISRRILLAYQEGAAANAAQLIGSVGGLVGVYLATKTDGGLVSLVLGYSGAQVLVSVGVSVWLFGWAKPEIHPFVRPSMADAKQVLGMGALFFVCQMATLVMFQKDNILITHYLGPTSATPYNVAWQLFFFLNAASIIVSPYLSPGFGEAFASGDLSWMRKAFRRYMLVTWSIAIPVVIFLSLAYEPIIKLWVGPGVSPNPDVVVWLALWTLLLTGMHPVVSVLVGVGRLRRYAFFSVIAAASSLVLSVHLVQRIGVVGVITASVISYLVFVVAPAFLTVRQILAGNIDTQPVGR